MNQDTNQASGTGLERGIFQTGRSARRLRIYIGEAQRWKGRALYEALVHEAREMHLAGATVFRSPMGFGAKTRIRTAKILRLSEDLPMVVEIIDAPARIDAFLPRLREMVKEGLVTVDDVGVLLYSAGEGG